jgi:acetyltransferase-like isoleucine patch superfamily enzyme
VALYGHLTFGDPLVVKYEGDDARVVVGRYSSIGEGVEFLVGGNHRMDWVSTFPFRVMLGLPGALKDGHPWSKGDIVVGSDVWIGRQALVLSGVRIGHGAVVAARATVAEDVPPYAIVAGNPARVVKYRVDSAHVEQLLAISWWDWPDEVVRERIADLNGLDHASFISKYGSRADE